MESRPLEYLPTTILRPAKIMTPDIRRGNVGDVEHKGEMWLCQRNKKCPLC